MLELMPGLIATQHSGEGKANQYFLAASTSITAPIPTSRSTRCRSTCAPTRTVKGMPISIFMIPELISTMHYSKGPFRLLADDAAQRPQTLFGKS